ncbi:hypothetical protein B0H16DRAFT_1737041 [Mycena metata]|uniref:F-box domain-containing protein n=1 Tax=Mycena metata TaxID=1033252 RepID=A0AAD7MMM7_9AGAR|nr:hypothetical protein B0H16DRAFT_1737041 [Mycena metata]
MSLCEIPQDVLLEVVKHFDVADLLRFLSVYQSTRELQLQRSLWLHAWFKYETYKGNLSLFQMPSRSIHCLWSNFNTQHTLSTGHTHVSYVQGTNLVVTYTSGAVSCWDIITSRRVAHLEIPNLHVVIDKPCLEITGRALFGACIGTQHLAAICVEYHDPGWIVHQFQIHGRKEGITGAVPLRNSRGPYYIHASSTPHKENRRVA